MYVDGSWQNRVKMIVEELSNSDTKEEALREHIIKNFVPDLKTTKPHPTNGINVFLKDKPEQPLSLGLFGYGFQRSVISYMLCMLNKNSVLGIDEFENGLHFDKQSMFAKELIEASQKYNTQLFLTSHSDQSALLFLEEIKNEKQEHNFSAIKLVKQDNSVVHCVYDFESTYDILTRGMNNPNDPFKLA
jgi:AAA15 family ATPase/GTPase